jgi:hypothetical protein
MFDGSHLWFCLEDLVKHTRTHVMKLVIVLLGTLSVLSAPALAVGEQPFICKGTACIPK